jgi:hypothetical protein
MTLHTVCQCSLGVPGGLQVFIGAAGPTCPYAQPRAVDAIEQAFLAPLLGMG